jgi:hypothetical protein
VTPIPAVPRLDVVVPEGELHGFFRISPQPNLDTSKTEAGSKQKDIPEENIAAVVNPVDGESEVETGSGTGKDPFVVVTNTGAGSKSNEDSSSGPGENALEGITIVEGGYEPRDGLNIKGAGPEDDSSTNISITGGAWEPGDGPDPVKVTPTPRPLQTFYDLYIISTDKSGGVLPDDFGLFRNTQIYTGFLDMRQSEDEQDPPWTVAFGLPEAVETESILTVDEEHKQEGFLPPFPKEKKQPNFPEELVRRHLGEEIIVYGYLDTEGRFKDLFIISQYESLLEARLRDALNTWEFRPARLYDKPVEVKIVMSIPLWLPEDVSK